jgi:biotin transport system substrate-specific component
MTITVPRLDRSPAGERGITIGDFLVPIRVSEGIGVRVRHLALILAGTLLIALAAQLRFYLPNNPLVPITGQTFAVLLVGGALGFRRGIASTVLYVALGLIGLPVFSGGGHGIEVLLSGRGGYIVGFIVAAAIVGRLAELGWDRNLFGSIGAMIFGSAAIYAIGVPWLAFVTGQSLDWAVTNYLMPFLPGDTLKVTLAAIAFPAAWWLVGRRPGDR